MMTPSENAVQPNKPVGKKRLMLALLYAGQNEWALFLFFLLLTLGLRAATFFQTSLGWDEGVYSAIARRMLSGDLLYVDVWDHKPPGIFVLFGAAFTLLGESILSIRILACLSVALSCFLIYRLGIILARSRGTGLIAAILYTFLSLNNGGLEANTEIFYNTFVLLAVCFLLRNNVSRLGIHPVTLLLTGLVVGLGIQINYFVVFDFLAILLITAGLLYLHAREGGNTFLPQALKAYGILSAGVAVPFLIAGFYFFGVGHFQDYLYANLAANSQYGFASGFSKVYFVRFVREQVYSNAILWVSMALVPSYLLPFRDRGGQEKRAVAILLVWSGMATLSLFVTWRFYPHYFLHLLPPACLLSAYLIVGTIYANQQLSAKSRRIILGLVLLVPLLQNLCPVIENGSAIFLDRFVQRIEGFEDEPLEVADYLEERTSPEDYIFNVDYPPVIYFLLEARIPTKFVFPLHLIDEQHSKSLGIDPVQELGSIVTQGPLYIIKQYELENPFYEALSTYLEEEYYLEHSINDVQLYRLRDGEQPRIP